MRVSVTTKISAISILTLAAGLGGCQRAPEAPVESPAPESAPATSAPQAAVPVESPRPEGVLEAYVWSCENGQSIRMRNLVREDAITIDMHEGGRKLSRVASASGAKYADSSLSFWTRGDTALFEREGEPPVNCREDRRQSLLADARIRGVLVRGTGNEPGWTLEVGPATRLELVTDYGAERQSFPTAVASATGSASVYTASNGQRSIKVSVTAEPCADDMSGEAFDHRMVIEQDGRTLRGCATVVR